MTRSDGKNAILKDGGPQVTSTKDLLGNGISRHVATIGARMVVIQNTFSLLESETSAKNRVSIKAVQGIPNDTIGLRLMMDPSPSVLRHSGAKGGCLQIYDDIHIPGVDGANVEQSLVWDMIL